MRSPALLLTLLLTTPICSAETLVYIGTYTGGPSEGIYVSTLNEASGELSTPVLAATIENPSFVAIHPSGKTLYAASEIFGPSGKSGGVAAFSIHDDGTLERLNQRSSGGGGACHVAVDPTGRCVGVANYGGGSCSLFPLLEDGSLAEIGSFYQHVGRSGVVARRQSEPHTHSINFNADGTQAFVADLGLDQILMYDVDPNAGTMEPSNQPSLAMTPGGGPRHFSLAPNNNAAFCNLEITSQVAVLNYDAESNSLSLGGTYSTLPKDFPSSKNSTAECLVHPSGHFVYVSNRGHNSIAVFEFDPDTRTLNHVENESTLGDVPRGFGIDPSGKFLIAGNQQSGTVNTFSIDAKTGVLEPTGHGIGVDSAVNVRFLVK